MSNQREMFARFVELALPRGESQSYPHVVAMVHVHSTTSILNHTYTPLLGVLKPSRADTVELESIVVILTTLLESMSEPLVHQVVDKNLFRTLVLLHPESKRVTERFAQLAFVRALVERALREVAIYVNNGIRCVEVENVGAPYFLGCGACPWEDLLAVHVVTSAIRSKYPDLAIGAHILSCNELEVLPIALINGCFFVRSESTLFRGLRPEGETNNRSNLARFLYIRNVLHTKYGSQRPTIPHSQDESHFPMIWSDIMKKHTVFPAELQDIDTWLHNITFAKLEGIIVTGAATGSDVDEASLKATRLAVDGVQSWNTSQFAGSQKELPMLPVVTGSGLNFSMYSRYADFMIVGTAFKKHKYWENEVDETEVASVMNKLRAHA